jgi:hypothetical protein
MKKWLQKLPLVAIALVVLFPFLPTPTTSAHDMHHDMSMECMPGEDCEQEMQKRCIEHCLEMAQSIEQSAYTLASSVELGVVRTDFYLAVYEQLVPSLPHNHSPPIDPRLHRITVQRE